MYSYPNSQGGPNLHSDFTQWWQNISVDSEFARRPKIWRQIKNCDVIAWPK
jgi:hypothetical protein